jgi:hypothetical protein
MTLEAASGSELKGLDNAWKGAEAYHFWLLAHQQLYNGQVRLAGAAGCRNMACGLAAAAAMSASARELCSSACCLHSGARQLDLSVLQSEGCRVFATNAFKGRSYLFTAADLLVAHLYVFSDNRAFVTVLVLQADAALRTALRLRQYDDVLDPADVYAFLALVGFYSNFYGTCSKVRRLCERILYMAC